LRAGDFSSGIATADTAAAKAANVKMVKRIFESVVDRSVEEVFE
jgi:hypothetical protein